MIIDFIQTNWVEILGALFGFLYLYFEYNVNIKMWPTGILMSVFYTYVFIYTKFYAFAIINIYYIIAGIYGWIKWNKAKNNNQVDDTKPVQTPTRLCLYILLSIGVIFSIISHVLANYTDSQVVYGDSFITTLSIVSMWMLAHKYVEQWLLVIVLNFASTIIYFQQNLYPTSIMYFVYAVVSILGYIKWKRLANLK